MESSGETDELYVTIGTPFDIPEETEPLKKASKVEDQIATDGKGRRRFHGAFTGGFSAGYFNTVGSKEGWTPSTFKSSRSKRNEISNKTPNPEDFMDDEDFADHGIAPNKLKAIASETLVDSSFDSQKDLLLNAFDTGKLPSAIPDSGGHLVDLLVPQKQSVGIQLLKKMGWKPGQGVGEQIEFSGEKNESNKKKVYGCALPPKEMVKKINVESFTLMLAPKDVQSISFKQKDDFHSIGYSGIVTNFGECRSTINAKDRNFCPSGKNKKGIRGQAFGVGAFEEDDDDIYGTNSFSKYDMTMEVDNDEKDGWTGTMTKGRIKKDCLPGFIKSSKQLNIPTKPVLVSIPSNIPRHVFPNDKKINPPNAESSKEKLSSKDRSNLLGEWNQTTKDVKHWTYKWDKPGSSNNKEDEETNNIDNIVNKKSKPARWDKDMSQIKPKTLDETHNVDNINLEKDKQSHQNRNGVYQPFSKYPSKQARYEIYLNSLKKKIKPDFKYDTSMTEWEKEREMAEFSQAAILFKPLALTMATRFVSANFIGSEETTPNNEKENSDKNISETKVTRTILNWHPDPIVCKRMNIPNPYPNSKVKGVPERNKKQISIFSDSFTQDLTSSTNQNTSVSMNQNIESEEEEDEFFSRMQKNKLKTIKSKVGPLSHLNINLNTQKLSDDSEKNEQDSTLLNSDTHNEQIIKPTIDIFKAIFDNSDSEDEEEEDEKVDESDKKVENNLHNHPVSETISEPLTDHFDTEQPLSGTKRNSLDTCTSRSKSNETPRDSYRKLLPLSMLKKDIPSQSNTHTDNDNKCFNERREGIMECRTEVKNIQQNSDDDKDCYKHKKEVDSKAHHKHKKRKKEKKSKKHKKKKYSSDDSESDNDRNYNKKEKKRNRSEKVDYKKSSSRGKPKKSRQSSTSSDEVPIPSTSVLLEKLKKYSHARPKAADFM